MTEHVDVLVVGAGLSGICAGYYLQTHCPTKRYAILEGRDAIGGTWDLFRYPGVRSDSEMYTLGYSFRPWRGSRAIVAGEEICSYIRETAVLHGIDQKIRFNHRVQHASWSSKEAKWTVAVNHAGGLAQMTCDFLLMCSGYYNYEQGHAPTWPQMAQFAGEIVHPQHWPPDLDYAAKRVVVIGSGATAVTLIPALAAHAAHVTMLQRSPTYIASAPAVDQQTQRLQHLLPPKLAAPLIRWKFILQSIYYYNLARRFPDRFKQSLLEMAQQELGADFDVQTHFTPRYQPWDQRLCLAPDGDFFQAIQQGKASIVTDEIAQFTKTGIKLQSGTELPADIIVTATGLKMQLMGGMTLMVDGKPVDLGQTMSYRGLMYSNVPNLASVFGYTNASWTLKCELITSYVCRLLNHMEKRGYAYCMPRPQGVAVGEEPLLDLTSGYVRRARQLLPRQGSKRPWKVYQNYLLDLVTLGFYRLNDGTLVFTRREPERA